jgi:hypothetical protein
MGKCSALHLLKYKRFCTTSLVGFSKPCCKEYTVQNNNNNNDNNDNNNSNNMNMQWMCLCCCYCTNNNNNNSNDNNNNNNNLQVSHIIQIKVCYGV